jgi:hypothetical protein
LLPSMGRRFERKKNRRRRGTPHFCFFRGLGFI